MLPCKLLTKRVVFLGDQHYIVIYLTAIMDDIGLIDIFRKLYPNKRSFTYQSKSLEVKSRIDFFLVSKSVVNWAVKTNTKVSLMLRIIKPLYLILKLLVKSVILACGNSTTP